MVVLYGAPRSPSSSFAVSTCHVGLGAFESQNLVTDTGSLQRAVVKTYDPRKAMESHQAIPSIFLPNFGRTASQDFVQKDHGKNTQT